MIAGFIKTVGSEWRAYLAEALGTFIFVFMASSVGVVQFLYGKSGDLTAPLVIGLCYSALIFMTVSRSGGYLNPAVTLALWLTQRLSSTTAFFYLLFQTAASFTAALFLIVIFGQNALKAGLGMPILGAEVGVSTGLVLEAVLCSFLVWAVFATSVDRNGPVSFGPLVLGFMIFALGAVFGPLSGAIVNPARVIGPAVVSGNFGNIVVWVLGPFAGAVVGLLYEFVFLKKSKKK